jgi:hypothetical protein
MWHPPAAVLIQFAVRPFPKWFWEEGKDVLDYGMLDQILCSIGTRVAILARAADIDGNLTPMLVNFANLMRLCPDS